LCDPLSLAATSVGLTAVQAGADYIGGTMQANAENKAVSDWSMAQSQNILNNVISEYGQGQQQIIYHDAAATQKMAQEDRMARSAIGTMTAGASSRGISGISVRALAQEYENRRDEFNADVQYNQQAQDDEIRQQMKGFQSGAQSQINSVRSHYLKSGPSILDPMMRIGFGALGAYDKFLRIPDPTPVPFYAPNDL